jgi:AraC family transcriptional regulator of adaptative response/methylated-DNA-[protein]-cysteine methyltransferase
LIERPDKALELPLDIRGADFQMRVWDALQKVPAGTTVNGDLAGYRWGI